jgi:hypothetical protein
MNASRQGLSWKRGSRGIYMRVVRLEVVPECIVLDRNLAVLEHHVDLSNPLGGPGQLEGGGPWLGVCVDRKKV